MTKNEALRDQIADLLENLDERGYNKWGRADEVIKLMAMAWDEAREEFGDFEGYEPVNPYRSTVRA